MMLSTGMERPVDELGRIVIPKEIRRSFGLETGTRLAISVDGNRIILEKSAGTCAICGATEDVKVVDGKGLCAYCIEKIKKSF